MKLYIDVDVRLESRTILEVDKNIEVKKGIGLVIELEVE